MKVTWDDSSKSEFEKEDQAEISYMCYMAIDDEVKSIELNESSDAKFDDEFNDLSYDKLLNDYHDLHKSYEKLILKNDALEKKISILSKELEDFSKEKEVILTCDTCNSLENKNASLNAKVLDLT